MRLDKNLPQQNPDSVFVGHSYIHKLAEELTKIN